MHTHIIFKKAPLSQGLLFLLLFCWSRLSGQVAMDLDGDNDMITLSAPANYTPGGDFTAEMWFRTGHNGPAFRRLFSIGDVLTRFEMGVSTSGLISFVTNTGVLQTSTVPVADNQWHCLSIIYSANSVDIFVDGANPGILSGIPTGPLAPIYFRLGHWAGYLTPGEDWQGQVDEFKLWNVALAPANLTGCGACGLQCNAPGLIAYWKFEEGLPGGNNSSRTFVQDCTPNGNDGDFLLGTLTPPAIALNGPVSNYVTSTAPLLLPDYSNLHIKLTDPLQGGISIVGICEGEPLHFDIVDASGNPVSASGNATVQWQYSDDCLFSGTSTSNIPPASSPSALFSGFSFVSPPNDPVLLCAGLNGTPTPNGFVDRCFRAIITVSNGINSCTYVVQPAQLRICCKLPPVTLTMNPSVPKCENDVETFTGQITGIPAPGSSNNYHITWTLVTPGGPIALTAFNDQLSVSYGPVTLVPGTYCLQATVSNCLCPQVTLQQCIQVDPMPVCGTIKVVPNAPILTPDPDGDPNHWVICPYNTGELMIDQPFTNCTPLWEFTFDPVNGPWVSLGSSNSMQNTNILPQNSPAGSPYLWPSGTNNIYYRIKCVPLSGANSGCPPCFSNILRICLKPQPTAPVITVNPMEVCKGSGNLFQFTVTNPDPNCNYEWFSNGLSVGFGDFLNTPNAGCYSVVCNDGCSSSVSNEVCVRTCEVVARVKCPLPVCPKVGDTITLDASMSYSTCGHPIIYSWSWTDANGVPHTQSGPVIMDIPDACGTLYCVTVTDTVLGCTDQWCGKIAPCLP